MGLDRSHHVPYKLDHKSNELLYPVIIEETSNFERDSHQASIKTWNRSDGSKPNIPEMVLFIASKVAGGTSFWIRLTSNGSISCINSERSDFWKNIRSQSLRISYEFFKKKIELIKDQLQIILNTTCQLVFLPAGYRLATKLAWLTSKTKTKSQTK